MLQLTTHSLGWHYRPIVIALLVLVTTGCGTYQGGQSAGGEGVSVDQRMKELERKMDTQSSRLNQFLFGLQDSLTVWRSGQGGPSDASSQYETIASNEVYFEINQYELDKASQETLDRFAMTLAGTPSGFLQIVGHTDQNGGDFFNEQLSILRAEAVIRYLVEKWDVPLNRMERLGYGMTKQKYPNDTGVTTNRNRRVEVILRAPKGLSRAGSHDLP